MRLTEKGIRASGLDRIGGGGVPSPAAQQSYVAPADVPAPSGRRTAFLPAALLALALLAGAAGAAVDAGPTLATAPTISGSATQGATLTATAGSWRGTGTLRYAYRWHRCDPLGARCLLLAGANAPRHKLTGADVGHTLAVDVRATDSSGATNGYSGLIGPIAGRKPQLVSVVQPGVTGTTTAVGGSVKVDNGKWTPAPKSFAYQWIRCNANGRACAPISGDITASHTIVPRDAKHALVAIVQARTASAARAVLSRATASLGAPATPPPPPTTPPPTAGGPVATVSPTATGPAVQGKKLTGVAGTWTGSGKIKYAYQWYRCDAAGAHCKSIHGSTRPTYTQVAKDAASLLGLTVRATDSKGKTSAYSSLIGPVGAVSSPLYSTAQPAISGTPAPGQALQVSAGSWSQTPTAYAYQWQRCNANGRLCVAIAGATTASYALTASDADHGVLAVVQATAGGASQSTWSVVAHVSAKPTGPIVSARPTVAGVAQQGKQLTANAGTWTGAGTIAYAYQWYRCDAAGAHCSSIHGAKKSTYTQVPKDVASTLGLTVRATDTNGTTNAYSSLVGPVAATTSPLYSTVQPVISGNPLVGQTLQVGTGTWSQTPTAYNYRWQRCNANGRLCTTIAGAVAATYVITAADAGHTLVAVVQATAGGVTQPIVSVGVAAA